MAICHLFTPKNAEQKRLDDVEAALQEMVSLNKPDPLLLGFLPSFRIAHFVFVVYFVFKGTHDTLCFGHYDTICLWHFWMYFEFMLIILIARSLGFVVSMKWFSRVGLIVF